MKFLITLLGVIFFATSCGYGPVENFKLDLTRVDSETVRASGKVEGASCNIFVGYENLNISSDGWTCYGCITKKYINTGSKTGTQNFDFNFSAVDTNNVEATIYCKGEGISGYAYGVLTKVLPKEGDDEDPTVELPWDPHSLMAATIPAWINLDWTDASDNETGFKIYRGTAPGGPYTLLHTAAANTSHYEDASGVSGTTYYYIIKAYNGAGESGATNESSATAF